MNLKPAQWVPCNEERKLRLLYEILLGIGWYENYDVYQAKECGV